MISLWHPIAQDAAYHRFADARAWLGVPNAWNVWSNLPFVIVGVAGLLWLVRHAPPHRTIWVVFFTGITLTGFGSAFYHWHPNNDTLVWDRLPMTISFMAFFAALVAERVNERAGNWLFVPLLTLGLGSVVYWHYTDDLRLYALVQFGPMLLTPVILVTRPAKYLRTRDVVIVLGWYVAAKVLERADCVIYAWSGVMSGHALKHLAAAAAAVWVLRALRREIPLASPAGPARINWKTA